MNNTTGTFAPPRPPSVSPWGALRRMLRRHPLRVLAGLLVLAITAAGLVTFWPRPASNACGDGVVRFGPLGQCVGVTDGSYVFDRSLAAVEQQILKANQTAVSSGHFVTVAYMMPMTLTSADTGTMDSVREELEGVAAVQGQANGSGLLSGHDKIRVLLANDGSRAGAWAPVTRQLEQLAGADHLASDHLVAVLGFGQSFTATKSAIQALAHDAQIPAIGSTVTADDLTDDSTAPDFFRVSPKNSDEGSALAHYLKQRFGKGKVLIVADQAEGDYYTKSLYNGFSKAAGVAGLTLADAPLNFRSGNDQVGFTFGSSMNNSVCVAQPKAVFFAGRGKDLGTFVSALGTRQCRTSGGPITVVTGDDAVNLRSTQTFRDALNAGGVELSYTALAAPGEWSAPGVAQDRSYDKERTAYQLFRQAVSGEPDATDAGLADGQMMMAYDSALAAVTAVRSAEGSDGSHPVTTEAVGQQLVQIESSAAVQGASGPIDLGQDRDPRNKPLALVQMLADQQTVSSHFDHVLWPLGAPWTAG